MRRGRLRAGGDELLLSSSRDVIRSRPTKSCHWRAKQGVRLIDVELEDQGSRSAVVEKEDETIPAVATAVVAGKPAARGRHACAEGNPAERALATNFSASRVSDRTAIKPSHIFCDPKARAVSAVAITNVKPRRERRVVART